MNPKTLAPILAVTVLLSVAAPAFASTGEETTDGMTVGVSQTDGVVVTVASNGTAVENASVTVTALNNSTYSGVGSYTTDANGTVSLPTPANNTTVEIAATKGNLTDSTAATLLAPQEKEETGDGPFGQRVSAFVHALISGEDVKHPGRAISDWVTQHNPAADKKSDRAGSKGSAGKNGKEKGDDHPGKGHGKDANDDGEERDDHPGNGKNGRGNGR
ncbi:hypothetical protein [Haladaptatus salinisoli]|uniref:hypothetical protein n=1 Tax=Haladaptatus salinisoli TaxID=2884876 RepID=UPI001D0ABEAA|nr:hypothetical protein [Haladaptatus salinisoli]